MSQFTGILGILAIIGACYAFSTDRKAIKWKIVAWGILLQLVFAVIVLKFQFGQQFMGAAGDAVKRLLGYAYDGASFVFGDLASPAGKAGFVFAFAILPTIIFMAAFFAVLYHFGIMQIIIKGAAWLMTRLMGVSGAESLDVAASIFMGQTEAPLTIRPFLPKLTRSELMTVMTAGMAHVSGGIMAAYIATGVEAKHLLGAVIMTAPGTLLIAKTLVPETETPVSGTKVEIAEIDEDKKKNLLGAIAHGTSDGLSLAINVAAMLIAFLALIALVNGLMGWAHGAMPWFPASLQVVLGWIFAPIAWLIGIPWQDAKDIGSLLGIRMVGNELLAFTQLGPMHAHLADRSFTIATYALCGFANLSSIGIQIGGIGALAPNRKDDLARIGFRAMLAGTAANLISAAIVGLLT
ncbi:MAG TPA: nucleoside transporter C-terminal domain-containing protein [Verrucomicrobiae bacterium]|jgi:CNT family concentrative nucleoside transporter|nr:nucleoside transporter C-terminal domain-containing protein [Verrucomicrobiae bacterium]